MNPSKRMIILLNLCWFVVLYGIIVAANYGMLEFIATLAKTIPWFDKFGHFILYGGLAFLSSLSLNKTYFCLREWRITEGMLLVLLLATIEELTQLYNTHRSFDSLDMLVNILAVLSFGYLAQMLIGRRRFLGQ